MQRTVIVGGGIMGLSIAARVALGRDPIEEPVVLLEKRFLGAGSSGRSGAILRQFYGDDPLVTMARDSLREYAAFESRYGRDIGFQRCGVLTIGGPEDPSTREIVERTSARMRALGVDARLVDARAMRELVPGIAVDDEALGAFEPDAGAVDPARAIEAFAARAREAGAITRLSTRVRAFAREGERIVGVETDEGLVAADTTIVAAGPWSRPLLQAAGVDLPLSVVRPEQHFASMPASGAGESARVETIDDLVTDRFGLRRDVARAAAHPVILDLERGYYTRCESWKERTRVGRLDYHGDDDVADPDALDEHVSASFQAWARERLESRLPFYRDERDAGSQAGLYTVTPDAQAVIGRFDGLDGLIVVTGFSGHGFKLAPSVGAGVAQMVAGESVTAFDADFFSARRFARSPRSGSGRPFGL